MSLPIRYSPMAFYFWLSIVFLTPQVLQHDLFRPLRDRHRLYPIPIAPSARYHVGDLSYDLQTTLLHFPFLVFSPYPTHSFMVRPIADHCTARSGPYHMFRRTRTLCSFYLLFVFKTFVSTPKKKEVFPPELRLKFILSHHFAPLRLCTFALSHLRSISHFQNPSPYHTVPNLHLTPLCTPWYYIRRPFHCSIRKLGRHWYDQTAMTRTNLIDTMWYFLIYDYHQLKLCQVTC